MSKLLTVFTAPKDDILPLELPWRVALLIYWRRLLILLLVSTSSFALLILFPLQRANRSPLGQVGSVLLGGISIALLLYVVSRRVKRPSPPLSLRDLGSSVLDLISAYRKATRQRSASFEMDEKVLEVALGLARDEGSDPQLAAALVGSLEGYTIGAAARVLNEIWKDKNSRTLSEFALRYLEYFPLTQLRLQEVRERHFAALDENLEEKWPTVHRDDRATVSSVSKRFLDVAAAIALLIFCFPVALPTAVYIIGRGALTGTSLDPIRKKTRVGLRGAEFEEWRFAVRYVDPASDRSKLGFFSALLLQLGLDVYPTLVKVLRGEMSLVGPRPLHPNHLAQLLALEAGYHDLLERLDVRPGLLSTAQVNALKNPGHKACLEYLKMDLQYVRHLRQSSGLRIIWLDLRIIADALLTFVTRPITIDAVKVFFATDDERMSLFLTRAALLAASTSSSE